MAENGRPKTAKPAGEKVKKPLGPIKMYVLHPQGVAPEQIQLVRSRRDMLDKLIQHRDLAFKEFTFERGTRGDAE